MWFENLFNINLLCGDTGKMNQKKLTKMKNTIAWQNGFARLAQDALNRYHFEGLPESISVIVYRCGPTTDDVKMFHVKH